MGVIRTLDRYLGLAIEANSVSYCLVVDDVMRKVGSISLQCASVEHSVRISDTFHMLRESLPTPDDTTLSDPVCFVGMRGDTLNARSTFALRRGYNRCRIRTIVECQSSSIFGSTPVVFKERELYHTIGRITNERISDSCTLVECARKRLPMLYNLDKSHFAGIAIAWSTAICLKRRMELESMKLDESFMRVVESRVKRDRIVCGLVSALERETDSGTASELQDALRSRINSLVDRHLDKLL
ncbi:hypothetical protein BBOV_III005930 [Babesia bovis T2Bo]|uniref:Uncharacterized protein n=1 Tax=Babesia bovis TaxID=5865 RepID=A7ANM0_BABBO|nr:hypothetical protein BBOV_III005930 [Babesia bovis T2Bo]EDO08154.1 hypothetical protein BBOV_III005930 [Babesia bovis T2Bo]|eukprot:XP_001611722.1 hypothetical protein [Babesia bovis T2Bo]